ncbi:MAG: hypothetical protein M0025_04310 [Elusimicrobia bacterium]|nr:hypothetical protein [Elusimicrobiota bacterium]MDA8243326.1 hypothetical protein [Elusimicrobiota bacterium]
MDQDKTRFDCQVRLIAGLREFSAPVPAAFAGRKEFFIVTLNRVASDIKEFKLASFRALSEWALARRRRGPLEERDVTAFKEAADKLLSAKDYQLVCAALPGSAEFLAARLAEAAPLSIADEEKKKEGERRDPAADRLAGDAYRRLGFDRLQQLAGRQPEGVILQHAGELVAEYCAVYRLPLSSEDTLPPFSLTRIDAVAGACFRLLAVLGRGGR